MSEQPKTINREELYQKLWKEPIVRLAQQLGYSYPELLKICAALDILRPSGGYWHRIQHGGASEQVPLPPAPLGMKTEIPFGPRLNAPLPPEPSPYLGKEDEQTTTAKSTMPQVTAVDAQPDQASSGVGEEEQTAADTSTASPEKPEAPKRVAPKFPNVVEMTREQLYEHVWTTPIHLLAEALGLSDVALAKTCVQMEIPKPTRGYWARLDAGEKLECTPLLSPSTDAVRRWTFNVASNRNRREARAVANLITAGKSKAPPRVELPSEQEPLHEIAERHRAALEKSKLGQDGLIHLHLQSLFRCDISPVIIPILVRAIHALVTELKRRGCHFVRGESDKSLAIAQGRDRLTVEWRESTAVVEREPTNEEKRKPSWTWQLKENKPTGQLVVEVAAPGLKGARSWTASESKPIEGVLGRVIEKIAATFEGFEAQRQREAEWERQRAETEKQRAEQEAESEKERKEKERLDRHEKRLKEIARIRQNNLGVAAQRLEDSQRVLAFINVCEKRWREAAAGELSPAQSQWLAWARTEAEKLGPWSDNYPDPESARICDPSTISVDGPYPNLSKLQPNEFSSPSPQSRIPSPYSQYGYSEY